MTQSCKNIPARLWERLAETLCRSEILRLIISLQQECFYTSLQDQDSLSDISNQLLLWIISSWNQIRFTTLFPHLQQQSLIADAEAPAGATEAEAGSTVALNGGLQTKTDGDLEVGSGIRSNSSFLFLLTIG